MSRYLAWALAALLLAPAAARAAECERGQPPQQRGATPDQRGGEQGHQPPPKWWIDPKLRSELVITDQQSAAVDAVWQKSLPALRELREKLEKLETALSTMTETADEAAVMAQIERVETTRAELNKGRTLMLYRMNKLLTPEQRAKVKAMFDRQPKRGGSSLR